MNSAFALIPAIFVAVICCLPAADKPSSDPAASLSQAQSFAFGGVGVAGIVTESERLFHQVLAHRDGLAEFRAILANGTPAAKLYALCGIRALDPASYNQAAEALKKENPKVQTIGGCMIMQQTAAGVIANISAGNYDSYWRKK